MTAGKIALGFHLIQKLTKAKTVNEVVQSVQEEVVRVTAKVNLAVITMRGVTPASLRPLGVDPEDQALVDQIIRAAFVVNHHREGEMPLLCNFFLSGKCKNGDKCNYFHPQICRYFAQGKCRKGNDCPFFHDKKKHNKATAARSVEGRIQTPPASAVNSPNSSRSPSTSESSKERRKQHKKEKKAAARAKQAAAPQQSVASSPF